LTKLADAKAKASKQNKINAKRLAAAAKLKQTLSLLPLLLLKKKKLLKLNQLKKLLQKKTTKKLKHKFRSEDA
jgi:hypothetical protein